ncbi:MAG: DUF2723 domain-containing protein [Bacteroidales bacterium]|nr:DUF2723 domain-containing protein [Bacteroidales bacterium]
MSDKNFKKADLIAGWSVFLIASVSYLLTIEPTASYWDCGEFICTAFRQEVGHPPGAPFFMILGRFFSLFAGGDVTKVAAMINSMSALASGFTVLFLYWSITHIAKRIICGDDTPSKVNAVSILGSGIVGALAFAYTDTFWFSAVEGEVYAMSSLFTALVFWCILKWESVADEKYSNRWLILICYLMGLSIGVHLLNLLVIPAIVLVYYFKKYKTTRKGVISALAISIVILAGVLYGIIPGVVYIASRFELVFTNGLGAPYNTGTIIYAILGIGGLGYGLYYSFKNRKAVLNTVLLGVTVIIIGYSCFAMIVIRSMANPPMDENNPDNVFALQSYLNREQYGDRPLIFGEYYNSKSIGYEDGSPVYIQKNDRYEIADYKSKRIFEPGSTTFFPRMFSPEPSHFKGYEHWAGVNQTEKPSFAQNLKFFFNYQVGYMYLRYFMWNFAGRQNDIQGHDENLINGNWISGFSFIDNARLGDQNLLPDYLKNNRGNNQYFFLPLLLGILGMIFMFRANKTGKEYFWIVMLFFVLTGVAIVVYLNQTPYQPRERDYAYAGSFYAFAFYIGFGAAFLCSWIDKYLNKNIIATSGAVLLSCFIGPVILAAENWDDHDRSGRYTARDFAKNYLESCAPNAILFTNGDNDTFPLWYAQEVEGIRTDVRVVNLAYINTDWYINQMRRKAYLSDPLPISIEKEKLTEGSRDIVYYQEVPQMFFNEKFADNKEKYSATLTDIYNKLIDIVKQSSLEKLMPKDYDAVVNKEQLKNQPQQIIAFINSLSQQAAKFGVKADEINALKSSSDNFYKSVCAEPAPLKAVIDFIASDDKNTKLTAQNGSELDFTPSLTFSLKVDKKKIIESGLVSAKDSSKIVDKIVWKHSHEYIRKGELMVLDILANNNWERPVYFAITVGGEAYQNLGDFFRLDGLAYKIVPVKTTSREGERGFIDTDVLYDSYMNKFSWGGIDNPKVYLDENNLRMLANIKSGFARLSDALIKERKLDKAKDVLERCYKVMPLDLVAPTFYDLTLADLYYKLGDKEGAHKVLNTLLTQTLDELNYFTSLDTYETSLVEEDYYRSAAMGHEAVRIARDNKDEDWKTQSATKLIDILKKNPILTDLTMQTIESQDFMRLYQTLPDFDKQMISIFLGLTDYLE